MKILAVLLVTCVSGLMQWRHERVRLDCSSGIETVCAYRMMRIRLVEIEQTCFACCDEDCETQCETSCGHITFPEEQVVREDDPDPGDPGEFCFDWDAGSDGPTPSVGETWILRVVAEDAAGNLGGCP